MTSFDREQSDYWFNDACRKGELLGRIDFWVDAPLDTPDYATPVSADQALAQIRRLLAEYSAERAGQTTGGGA
ncbi:hypothetical protein [Planosporangium mesophilum]|uniref:Uncharacterized protein n=1 Tax=Planosporangium mesophilum TaxID=689768 RepID=A0A8J3X1C3_9ACTN|nr:hypothetical protein [Planosporangium mesophilum]NJC85356.1 hypothetical protein [Planosporangium mesophilum]GII23179.1 hypothetical protein Pme01_27760 [Planosporangium mesophilum]